MAVSWKCIVPCVFVSCIVLLYISYYDGTTYWGKSIIRRRPNICVTNCRQQPGIGEALSCSFPVEKIVFAKTHKTASSTVASIIDRYALNHQLSAPVRGNLLVHISNCFHFKHTFISPSHKLDIFSSHVRYDHKEFELAIPGAKHVTILRNPIAQFESAFSFFDVANQLNISNFPNPIEIFFVKPDEYINHRFYRWETVHNHQLFDLGFDTALSNNTEQVDSKIQQLSNDFDLVMITEYFDESLILLKLLLCWDFDDILYLPKNKRSSSSRHYTLSNSTIVNITRWNEADMKLYKHFNNTFWKKVDEYGNYFHEQLREFKNKLKSINETCITGSRQVEKKHRGEILFEEYELNDNLSFDDIGVCKSLLQEHSDLLKLIRKEMIKEGKITDDNINKRKQKWKIC